MARAAPCHLSHREHLPAGVLPVAELLGDAPLLALIEAHGGTRLYVPQAVTAHDPLAVLLGLAPAQRLVRAYGRDTVTIPLCKRWRAWMLRDQGLTHAVIGRRLGMHEQSVFVCLNPKRKAAQTKHGAEQMRLLLD